MRRQPLHSLFTSQRRSVAFLTTCLLLLLTRITVAQETDTRVHADGKGWRLEQARIIDTQRPRVLLVGDSILNGYLRLARGDQFHWTAPAYKLLADAVVAAVERELPAGKLAAAKTVEPSNAQELAAKKIEQEKAIDEEFQQWKASLTAEQRRWEETLEACLGSFYLPLYKRAKVQGQATAWDYVKDDPKLPRVLLIGDSISRGYTLAVRKALAGKVNVHRAPENCGPTANGLKKLDIWLGDGKWDAIHFNFGIHDRKTSPSMYEERLETIVKRLEATRAKLIWASSTPLPAESQYGSDTAILERNQIAAKVMARHSIPIDDLYTHIRPRLAEFQNPNDCHFSGPGYEFLGRKVAEAIRATLPVE